MIDKPSEYLDLDVEKWLNAEDYITLVVFCELCGKSRRSIDFHIDNDRIKDCLKKSNRLYINKREILKTFLATCEESIEYFGLSRKTIEFLVNEGYIKKYIIEDTIWYDTYLSKEFQNIYKPIGNFNGLLTFEMAYKFLCETEGLKVKNPFGKFEDFELFIISNRNTFCSYRISTKNLWYVNKNDLYKYFCYTVDDAKKMLGTSTDNVLKKLVNEGYLQKLDASNNYYINLEGKSIKEYELNKAKRSNSEPKLNMDDFDTPTDIIEYYFKLLDDVYLIETKILAKKYLYYVAETSQDIKLKYRISQCCRWIVRILKALKKELYLYTDAEIAKFYDNMATRTNNDIIRGFALFVAANTRCVYSPESVPVYLQIKNDKTMDDIYSSEIMEKYFHYLADINKHFEKAYYDQSYANLWLIALLHLSLDWRMSDILLMPNVDIEAVKINSFDEFLKKGINMADSQVILDQMNEKTYGKVAHKNGWQIPFVRDLDLMVLTAAAFILCELHRRKNNDTILFNKFRKQNPTKHYWNKLFEDTELKDFENQKFNRSLMTYLFEYANNNEGLKTLAYTLITGFRGHIVSDCAESNTTQIYLDVITIDGHLDDASMQVQRRGTFGFLWDILLKLAYDTEESSVEDVTRQIENIRGVITAQQLEDVSLFLTSNENQKEIIEDLFKTPDTVLEKINEIGIRRGQKIVNDLGSYIKFNKQEQDEVIETLKRETKKSLVDKIDKISRGKTPSKLASCQCFKGIKDCQYKTQEEAACAICKYSIPLIFCLSTVKQKIYELIRETNKISIDDHFSLTKNKILLLKYMSVISAANAKFSQYDKDFISAYIDMDDLKQKVLKLEQEKLYFI
jgi:hypothetical protein